MELLQLKYFQVAARHEHMTKAANELLVSQPALSKTISRLEKSLGTPLFDREGRNIRLNSFGKIFLERVNRIFQELEEGKRQVQDMAGLDNGIISVSISLPHILPFLLMEFMEDYPNVKIKQLEATSIEMKQQLENGDIDFCVSTIPIKGDNIEWVTLMEEEIFLSVPPNHFLANRDSIKLCEVKNESFINRITGYQFRELTDDFCRQAGFQPNTTVELGEAWAILKLVEMGIGVSFTPQLSLLRQNAPSTKQLRISQPKCMRTVGIAWNKMHFLSTAADTFRRFTINFFENKAEKYFHL
ncbi:MULTISPECIES: LysR family transcriptional regulator [Bacillus]|uniref:LysR family transcriptional regulator n=1 Tax=Bacillus TaxID=1386 RepID=UPI0003158D24|nr:MULTISPECIES: LysR family transcriptional regulator [Bacillus]